MRGTARGTARGAARGTARGAARGTARGTARGDVGRLGGVCGLVVYGVDDTTESAGRKMRDKLIWPATGA